jgi:hypothetical protein
MSETNSATFAEYILSLPQKEATLRQQAAALTKEADSMGTILKNLDRKKLDELALTGNPKLDAALRLSMESGRWGADWLRIFPQILAKIERAERDIAEWKPGGLMIADFTPQNSCPCCLDLAVIEVSAGTNLQITMGDCYFSEIPFTIWIPGRYLITAKSNTTPIGITRHENIGLTGVDLIRLFHPNWGTWRTPLAGIFLGEKAIANHVEGWKEFVSRESSMDDATRTQYLKFLDEFHETVRSLVPAPA